MPLNLEFRFARPAEIPAIARLIAHSFPGPTRTPDWWENQLREPPFGGGPETVFVAVTDGHVVAALQLHPLRQHLTGRVMQTAGVGSVAVSPTHRRLGIAARLMTAAFAAARARGDVASALYPFRVAFYGRLGYGQASVAEQWLVAPSSLPDAPERHNVVRLDDDAAHDDIRSVYDRWAPTQNGQMERTEAMWRRLLDGDRELFGWRDEHGELRGYALVAYRTDLPRRTRFLEVDELVWVCPAARRGLIGWLSSLSDQWERVMLRALPAHRLGDLIAEPRLPDDGGPWWQLWAPAATLMHGTMFRVLDIAGAAAARPVQPDVAATFTARIRDAQVDANDGGWSFTLRAGSLNATRTDTSTTDLELGIAAFSRIFIGALSPSQARAAGLLTCDDAALLDTLDRALALPEPWTFERF